MASLFFKMATMDAGKSTNLLQAAFNYKQKGMNAFLLTAALDNRYGVGKITSRLGISSDANVFLSDTNIYDMILEENSKKQIHCVMIDESQFLSKEQVSQVSKVVDELGIAVICYGLRTDFRGELFEGSKYLLAWSDKIEELKTMCFCGKKATMVLRVSETGEVMDDGEQVKIGGNDCYKSVCRKHFNEKKYK